MRCINDHLRVLICGAASGVGLACAEAFAARGAELVLCDHDGTGLTRAAERLGAHARFCDSTADTSVAIFAADVESQFPSIDVLINAAGRGYVRTLAMMRMTRALMPLLRAGKGRRFVFNVAPLDGFTAAKGIFPYAGSLAAFERLSEALAEQVRGTAIEMVSFTPKLARAQLANRAPADQLYRLQRVDEGYSAEQIVRMVSAQRPEWRHRPSLASRRA
jgi:NADP-dependent 3-hydroxy acid dehydrogenase YdfG